jgi:hypothetical protein
MTEPMWTNVSYSCALTGPLDDVPDQVSPNRSAWGSLPEEHAPDIGDAGTFGQVVDQRLADVGGQR